MSSSSRSTLAGIFFLAVVAAGAIFTWRFLISGNQDPTVAPAKAPVPKTPLVEDPSIGISLDRLADLRPEVAPANISFTIRLYGAAGASDPLAAAQVSARPVGPGLDETTEGLVQTQSDATGTAQFRDLKYKTYEVKAEPPGFYPLVLGKVLNGDDLKLIFEKPVPLPGVVVASDTQQPVPGASMWAYSGLEGELAVMQIQNFQFTGRDTRELPEFENRIFPSYRQSLVSDESGALTFLLPPGYSVRFGLSHPDYDSLEFELEVKEDSLFENQKWVLVPRTEIFGVVIDDETKKPVAGATIKNGEGGIPVQYIQQLGGSNEIFTAVSDEQGRYRLTNVPRGKQYFNVTHPDFDEYLDSFEVTSVEPYEKEVRLRKGAIVQGRIVDSTNRPVANAQVSWAIPATMIFARNLGVQLQGVPTVEDGSFSLSGVPIGESFTITVQHPDYMTATQENVKLSPGEALTGMEIVMLRGGSITGLVRSASDGKAIGNASITATPSTPPGPALTRVHSDDKGNFVVLNTPAGRHELTCEMDGYCSQTIPNLADTVTGVNFDLVRESRIKGQLVNQTTGEAIGKFKMRGKMVGRSVQSKPIEMLIRDKKGEFVIDGLFPGSWDLEFTCDDTAPLLLTSISLAEGQEHDAGILYATQGARAVGRVTNAAGQPVYLALVRFELLDTFLATDKTYTTLQTQTDNNGEFTMPRLRSGRYNIIVTHPRYAQIKPPEAVIEDGPETRIDIELPRPASLELHVRDSSGNSVTGARAALFRGSSPLDSAVRVVGESGGRAIKLEDESRKGGLMTLSDAAAQKGFNVRIPESGEITWKRKEPGEWTLWVMADGFDRYERHIVLRPGEDTVEEAVLYPKGQAPVPDPEADDGKKKKGRRGRDRNQEGGNTDGQAGDDGTDQDGGN